MCLARSNCGVSHLPQPRFTQQAHQHVHAICGTLYKMGVRPIKAVNHQCILTTTGLENKICNGLQTRCSNLNRNGVVSRGRSLPRVCPCIGHRTVHKNSRRLHRGIPVTLAEAKGVLRVTKGVLDGVSIFGVEAREIFPPEASWNSMTSGRAFPLIISST